MCIEVIGVSPMCIEVIGVSPMCIEVIGVSPMCIEVMGETPMLQRTENALIHQTSRSKNSIVFRATLGQSYSAHRSRPRLEKSWRSFAEVSNSSSAFTQAF
jgi:hypothetical protein